MCSIYRSFMFWFKCYIQICNIACREVTNRLIPSPLHHLCQYITFEYHISNPALIEHDDVIQWKHFPRNWSFLWEIHGSPVNSLHKGQWRGALMFSLICAWINGWVNYREAGDLRRHRSHYNVTVMTFSCMTCSLQNIIIIKDRWDCLYLPMALRCRTKRVPLHISISVTVYEQCKYSKTSTAYHYHNRWYPNKGGTT